MSSSGSFEEFGNNEPSFFFEVQGPVEGDGTAALSAEQENFGTPPELPLDRHQTQDSINAAFANIVTDEQELAADGEPRVISRPSGITETTIEFPNAYSGEITLFGRKNMTPAQRAVADTQLHEALRKEFGRTEAEHAALKQASAAAKQRHDATLAAHEKACREAPGTDAQLAALHDFENAKDAYNAALNALCFNDFTPIIKQTPRGRYVNGEPA